MRTTWTILVVAYGLMGLGMVIFLSMRDLLRGKSSVSGGLVELLNWLPSAWGMLVAMVIWPLLLVVWYYESWFGDPARSDGVAVRRAGDGVAPSRGEGSRPVRQPQDLREKE